MINTAAFAGDRIAGRSDQWTRPLNSAGFILAATDNPWVSSPTQRAYGFPHYYNAKKDNPFQSRQINQSPVYNSRNSSGKNEYNSYEYNRNRYDQAQSGAMYPGVMQGVYPSNATNSNNGMQSSRPYYGYQMQPRYVTPAILKSIRKQQMRTQQALPSWQHYPYHKRNYWQYNPSRNGYGRGGNFGNSPGNGYGNGSVDSAFPVKPGTLLDESLLDGNGGLPLTPDVTAIGGISPLSTNEPLPPELSGNNYYRSGRYFDPMAFNPSSMFGPFNNFTR